MQCVQLPDEIILRPLNCELNSLAGADGSALLSQGETIVLGAMYGPIEARCPHTNVDFSKVDVIYRPKGGLPRLRDKYKEYVIKNTCKTAILTALHPRTSISIQLQEMENRGGLEACAINAACLALLNGGVPMKFTVAAVHSIIDRDNQVVLDPNNRQAAGALASFTFVFDGCKRNLIACNTFGTFNTAQYNTALMLCQAASVIVFRFYRQVILHSIQT